MIDRKSDIIRFTKMQGIGNDYVYIDCTKEKLKENPRNLAMKISDRHFGVGADGMILICKSDVADFKMRMFNYDGTESEMCGNGIRCVGKYVYDKKLTDKKNIEIETLAGIKKLTLNVENEEVETVKVDMGLPILEPKKIPVITNKNPAINLEINVLNKRFRFTCVSMGNPHAVTEINNVDSFDVEKFGKTIEEYKIFPNKTNVAFIEIINPETIKMRVWERGTGETLACGTGACASLVASCLNKKTKNKATIKLLGGDLQIEWDKINKHIYMTGPAKTVFEGAWKI